MKKQLQSNTFLRSFFWCFAFLMVLLPSFSSGQTTVSYTAMTTITFPATPVATISPTVAGLTFSQISRGSGVTSGAAAGSISGAGFNGTLATNITGSKWYTFSITSNASTTFTLSALSIVSRVSAAVAGNNVSVQYSIGGSVPTTVIGSYTPTASAATYAITPSAPISVGANQVLNIYIIPNLLSASGTTCRVENNTSATVTASAVTSLSTEPTTQADTVAFTSVGSSAMTVGWNNGNGNRRAVFMRETAGTITNPTDGIAYTASANWSSKGTQLGTSGYYCIYDGTGSSVALTNLVSGTNYVVQVFEYNADSASAPTATTINYYVPTATSNPNNQTTLSPSLGTSPGLPISGLSYAFGSGPSNESATFKIAGINFTTATGNITVTPSSNIEIYDGTAWQSAAFTVPFTANAISTSLIYKVRLKAGLAIATYPSELVTISGGGAINTTIAVSGAVVAVPVLSTSPTSYTGLTYILGAGPSPASATFAITANNLVPASGNITLTPSSNIEIYDGAAWQSAAFDVAYTAGAISTASIYQVRLKAGLAVATYSSEMVGLSNGTTTASITINASVTAAAAPVCPSGTTIASSTSQVLCQGTSATALTSTISYTGVVGTPTLAYQWYYNTTNSNTISGAISIYGATLANYTPLSTAAEVGTRYYFCVGYATDVACAESNTTQYLASNAVSVTVNATPATPSVSNNGPVCQGTSLNLSTPMVAGATYSWSGPNSFSSIVQNATVSATATTAMAGDYFVTTTVNGCSSASSLATTVVVNPTPTTPTASTNGAVCLGDTLSLSTPTVSNATYSWTGPNSFTSSSQNPTVSTTTTAIMAGTYNVTVTVSGCVSAAGATTATVNSALVVGSVSGISTPIYGSNVVISQVYGGGGNTGATYTNDFIELYNPTATAVSLIGWKVQYASAAGAFSDAATLTGSIGAGKYYLIQLATSGAVGATLPTPDVTGATNMGAGSMKVQLINGSSSVIDLLGTGTASTFEGTAAPALSGNILSYQRKNSGCTDTNNNANDFTNNTVATARNSAAAANTCSVINYTESICTGTSPSATSVSVATGSTGTYTYQWYSYNGITTPAITPATSSWTAVNTGVNLTTSTLTQNITYACFVTPIGCGTGAWASNYKQVTVNALPAIPTITPSGSTSIVTGGNVTLTASAGTTYLWSTGATTSSIVVSTAGTYSVQVTNANGCSSAASTAVAVYVLPTVTTTTPVSNLTVTSATLSGAVTNIGAAAITATGIVYALTSANASPIIGGSGVVQLSTALPNSGTSTFSENTVTALTPNTNYSYCSYATSSQGTSYGAVATFNTLSYSPSVTVTSSNPAFGSVCTTGSSNSTTASFAFNGIYLDGTNLTISSASAELTFATTQTGVYATSLSLSAGATLTGQMVWVKFTPSTTGAFSGTVAISGGGLATALSVSTSGTGINTPVITTTGISSSITSTGATLAGSYLAGCSAVSASGIEYSLSNSFTSSTSVSGFPAVVTGLLPNTLYYYRAYATDATGTVTGTILSFTTLDLSAPLAITANPISYDSFTANWNAVTAATSYKLDVSTHATFTASSVVSGAVVFNNAGTIGTTGWTETAITQSGGAAAYLGMTASTSTLITPSLDLTNYAAIKLNFKARSFGGTNASANTITVSVSTNNGTSWTTLATRTPASSTLTAVAFYDLSSYNVAQVKIRLQTLNATGSIGVGVDDLILSGDQTVQVPSFVTGYENLAVNGTSQAVTGLTPLTTYYYRVRAVTSASTSPNSNTITVTTTPPPATFGSVALANATVCANSNNTFNLTGLLANSTSTISYTINNGSVQTVSGVVASASGTASFDLAMPYSYNGQVLAITQIERSDLVSPILTVTSNNSVTLSVNPTSVAGTASGTTPICTGTTTTLSLTGSNGTIQWQQSLNGTTGWLDVANATSATLNTGNLTTTTYYHAVVTSGICSSATSNVVMITLNPKPVIANKTAVACSGSTFTVTPTNGSDIVPIGTTYSWSAPTAISGITGLTAGTYSSAISGTLSNTTNAPIDVVYSVTPSANVVPISVAPVVNFIDRLTTYTGVSLNGLGNTASVSPGATVSISYSYGVSFSGNGYCPGCVVQNYIGIGGTNQSIDCQNYINDGSSGSVSTSFVAPTTPGVYYITQTISLDYNCVSVNFDNSPTYAIGVFVVGSPAYTCAGTPFNVTVTVNPTPSIGNATATVCSGSVFTVSPSNGLDVVPVGTTYSWSAPTAISGITGLAAGTNASTISGTIINSNTTAQNVVYAVTPISANGCIGTSFNVTVTVNPNVTYYADADHDGYGNLLVSQVSCMGAPTGYVTNSTDCNDANPLVYRSGMLYTDADGDHYTIGTGQVTCYGVVPVGYSTTTLGTDCDDTRATSHPGAVDICNDGIDNDCNGTIDNVGLPGGCAPLVSYVSPNQCGTTLNLIDDQVVANLVANAQGYRWRITKMVAGVASTVPTDIQMLDTSLRVFKFTQLASYAFGTTYQIEVAVKINNNWLPYFGAPCTVSTPATTTKVTTAQCGTTLTLMTDVVYANLVSYATGYRFKVTNLLTNNVQVIDRSLREFRFNLLSNIPYNTPFKVEVAVKNTNGTYLTYGPSCTVTTPLFPTTSLQDSQCDYAAVSPTEMLYANLVANATAYRYSVSNTALGYTYIFDKVLRVFALNTVPGLLPSTTYSVKVAVQIGGVWGPYGKICTLTTPGVAKTAFTNESLTMFTVTAYPNPFAENFQLEIKTSSEEALQVKVYDMLGKLVENRILEPIEVRGFEIGANYPTGVYNVMVSQGDNIKTLRVIKR